MTAVKYKIKDKNGKWKFATPPKWYFQFFVQKKRVRSRPIYDSKREALAAEKIERDRYVEHVERKYSDVYQELSDSYTKNVSQRGRNEYDSVYQNHIKDFLPDRVINRYTRSDMTRFIEDLEKNGRTNATINKVVSNVNRTMRYACKVGYSGINPFEYTPKLPTIKKEKEFMTYDEYLKFRDYIKNPMYHLMFEVLFWTGVRKGELLALQWKDVDFDTHMLRVRDHFVYAKKGTYIIVPGRKNKMSYSVEVHSDLIRQLKEWKEAKKSLDGFNDDFFLFGDYRPVSPEGLRRQLNKGCQKAHLKHVDIHSFRHSHVSYCYNYCPELTIQDIAYRIGDTVKVVLETYSHIFANRYGKYSGAIEKAISRMAEEKKVPGNDDSDNK